MTQIQRQLLELIHTILNKTDYLKPGLKDNLDLAIRHFPEITSDEEPTWRKIDLYLSHLRISERGAKIIDANYGNNDLWKLVHFEHIVPVSVTRKDLQELGKNPTLSDVKKVLIETEVIILSKEEAKVLDGRIDKSYPLEGKLVNGKGLQRRGTKKERLESLNIKIDKRYRKNKL